jgi:hypothetical protein
MNSTKTVNNIVIFVSDQPVSHNSSCIMYAGSPDWVKEPYMLYAGIAKMTNG